MANYAEEPLTKITINLFKKDVDWFREKYPKDWSRELRQAVRRHIGLRSAGRCEHGLQRDLCGTCSIHLEVK